MCSNEKFGPQIQKHVKTLVGEEMAPDLYPLLFDQIRGIVDKFFDQQGQVRPVKYERILNLTLECVKLYLICEYDLKMCRLLFRTSTLCSSSILSI